ncbi:transient receptor potential cation channel protein painless-like [Anopheles ziemanni]|uniref:transient receptor potential cation channel protein painless-like n=1 Tax=Anopheles coustani TaxID=139045 RepID=UPI002658D0F9|nr:transient receptor potential cation channel protein painless-like [Anopheles coustani]XP_058169501.1 transient receptor potential cation channel protein painless-like [Anopheles ziemanni]
MVDEALKKQKKLDSTSVGTMVERAEEFDLNALERGENIDVNHREDGSYYSRFENACKSPGAGKEIKSLISRGAKVNEMNPETEEFPIHLVAQSGDPSNVAALLEHGSTKIYIDQDHQHDTALFIVFRRINKTNFESHFECIKHLLAHGADINMTNKDNIPPIACRSLSSLEPAQRNQLIAHCRDKVTFYARGDYGRERMVKTFGESQLPPGGCPDYGAEPVTVGQLRSWLFGGEEDKFLGNYRQATAIYGNFKCQIVREFLLICAKKGYEKTITELMKENVHDVAQYRSKLVEKCSIYGNDRIISLLTVDTEPTPQSGDLLHSIIPLITEDSDECAHYRCVKAILKNRLMELDRADVIGNTALHYAVRYNLSNVQKMLLKSGAYVGVVNKFDELPIAEMDPTTLEDHLDSCVTCEQVIIGDRQYEINVDVKNFVPPIHKVTGTSNVHASENDEMRCCMVNAFLFVLFVCIFFHDVLILVGNRKMVKFRKSLQTVCHVCFNFILLCAPVAFPSCLRYRWIPAFIILWRATQWTALLGTLSILSWSISLVMFKTVAKNILKFLALYFVLIVAFALGFNILCSPMGSNVSVAEPLARNVSLNLTENRNFSVDTIELADTDEDSNNLLTISSALLSVSLMIMGNVETDDIQPNQHVGRYIFFTVFLFAMPLVLFILMNALAVTDTTSILEEAELISIAKTASVIHKYEHLGSFCIGGSSPMLKIFSNNAETHFCHIKINRYQKMSNQQTWASLSELIFCQDLVSKRDTKVMQILSNSRNPTKGKADE